MQRRFITHSKIVIFSYLIRKCVPFKFVFHRGDNSARASSNSKLRGASAQSKRALPLFSHSFASASTGQPTISYSRRVGVVFFSGELGDENTSGDVKKISMNIPPSSSSYYSSFFSIFPGV